MGYVGTVDYCKLHPNFLKMCIQIDVPGIHFVVCGGPCEAAIRAEAKKLGVGGRFTFTGQVERVGEYLAEIDVFGYPLSPTHYGTCDQALAESMAAGVPPVVLSNPMERHMVEHRATGIVAKDEDAYARAIEELYSNPDLRAFLSSNGRTEAPRKFSLEAMIAAWEQVFDEMLKLPKKERRWTGRRRGKDVSAAEVFLESLGEHGRGFGLSMKAERAGERAATDAGIRDLARRSHNWRSDTRGTAHHYHFFFPEDEHLKLWSDLTHGT